MKPLLPPVLSPAGDAIAAAAALLLLPACCCCCDRSASEASAPAGFRSAAIDSLLKGFSTK
jgi:hypothetical protein